MDARAKILKFAYLRHPQAFCGADLFNELKMLSGSVYPALEKLDDENLLWSFWSGDEFPRKRMFALTRAGLNVAAPYALSPVEGIPQR